MQGLKPVRKILYAKVYRSSKDLFPWAGKQMQYSPPWGLARNKFFRDDSRKQKSFHLLASEPHD